MNIYEVALGKRYRKRCWKVRQVDVGEVVGNAGVGGDERWVGRGGEREEGGPAVKMLG